MYHYSQPAITCHGQGHTRLQSCSAKLHRRLASHHRHHAQVPDRYLATRQAIALNASALAVIHVGCLAKRFHRHIRRNGRRAPQAKRKQVSKPTTSSHERQAPLTILYRLADQSVDVLKHITLRGGVWPNACAASIRDLSRHLNKPSKKLPKSPETDPARQQFPNVRFNPMPNNSNSNNTEPIDGLSTLAGAAEVHATFDSQHHARATPYSNNNNNNNNNQQAYSNPPDPTAATTTTTTYFPDEAFTPGFPSSTNHGGYNPDFPAAGGGPWQQSDSLFDLNNVELFAGFDIPFWLDDEHYVPFLDG
jgi:hypothetical protein